MGWVREALSAIAELGAATLLTPEYRAQDPIPLFPPYPDPLASELLLVEESLEEISQIASQLEMLVVFEPIHSYMTRFWHNVDKPLSICKQLGNSNLGLALDFNVMNATEASIPDSIQRAGSWVRHIHLADNNRLLPGQGHIDFGTGLKVLREIGYGGWFSFECVASDEKRFVEETKASIELIKHLWLHTVEE
jgi:sugar phosphate isomerase/epimerase